MQEKRHKYLETRRTTTHWPAPIQVVGAAQVWTIICIT